MAKEIETRNTKVGSLINQIETGEVKIPPLQRPFVWKIEQIIDLLESIYKDYPIGSLLLWQSNNSLPSARNVAGLKLPEIDPEYPFLYVLDGQQRLSSLYGVFAKERARDRSQPDEYKIDENIFDIYFDLKKKEFVHKNNKEEEGRYISLQILLDTPKFISALKDLNEDEQNIATELLNQFSNYDVPIVVTKKRELQEVGVIFERVNNTGSKLDLFDLMVAITWREDFHLQQKFSVIHKTLSKKQFDGIKDKIILQCISTILKESSKTKVIMSLEPENIIGAIDKVKESLEKTIDYLATNLFVKSVGLLPHAHQIVPLCYFFSKSTTPTGEQKKVLNSWFWKTSFSRRYSSATDRNVDEDVANFKKLAENNDLNAFKKLDYSVTEETLKEAKFSKNNSSSRALIVLLANNQPKDLTNGCLIDAGDAISSFNRKEYHHVFPRSFLESISVSKDKISSLCNFCILPSASNKIISDKSPSDYFVSIVPSDEFIDILESNLLPVKKEIYGKDNYELFLSERAKKIIDAIDKKII